LKRGGGAGYWSDGVVEWQMQNAKCKMQNGEEGDDAGVGWFANRSKRRGTLVDPPQNVRLADIRLRPGSAARGLAGTNQLEPRMDPDKHGLCKAMTSFSCLSLASPNGDRKEPEEIRSSAPWYPCPSVFIRVHPRFSSAWLRLGGVRPVGRGNRVCVPPPSGAFCLAHVPHHYGMIAVA
jgi:hypothetical protein